jgi:uncharacterized membrane-anchored protein YhcB (DUF1043 family)
MFSVTHIIVYVIGLVLGVAVGFVFKYISKQKTATKLAEYQKEIFRSHSRISMLEGINNELEKKLGEYSNPAHRISA